MCIRDRDTGMRIFPVDRQRLIDLQILARLNASTAKNTLVGIVTVKGIRQVDAIRLRLVRNFLVFDGEKSGGVVDRAVAVAVVADGAIQEMIAEDTVCLLYTSTPAMIGVSGAISS